MSSIVIQGDTSGSITVEAPSVAGTHTLTLPKATGNIATDATVGLGVKNLIINGDMRIAQRGTSATGITTNGYRTCDRWNVGVSAAGTWTITQDTDVPSGQGFANSIKYDCTTANASLNTNDYIFLAQFFEGQNLQHLKKGTSSAESVTLSFWVKSNKTGTYTVEVDDNDNNRSISKTYTIDTADTWEKKTLTFTGDTTGTFDNDNGNSLRLYLWLGAGSTWSSGTLQTTWGSTTNADRVSGSNVNIADSTSNYINFTGVQLELGENATPFENRMYGTELALCQRYYYKWANGTISSYVGLGVGGISTTNTVEFMVKFPVTMRTTPSLDVSNISSSIQVYANAVSNISTINTNALISNPEAIMCNGTTSGLTTGNPAVIYANNNTSVYASASAEL